MSNCPKCFAVLAENERLCRRCGFDISPEFTKTVSQNDPTRHFQEKPMDAEYGN